MFVNVFPFLERFFPFSKMLWGKFFDNNGKLSFSSFGLSGFPGDISLVLFHENGFESFEQPPRTRIIITKKTYKQNTASCNTSLTYWLT